jgi:hypothetical protein
VIARPPPFHSATAQLHAPQHWAATRQPRASVAVGSSNERALKLLIAALFLPEGLSFFFGDFRLSVARLLIIVLTIYATAQYVEKRANSVFVPSDLFAVAAGLWMIIATTIMQGPADGLKSGGIMALEFTGAYWVFRHLLGPLDSSVRVVAFATKLLFLIVALAVLDPLTNKLFTYETVKALTGYSAPAWEWAKETFADTMFRKGIVRAMGPLEHSILFGTVCAWFGTLAICTFPSRLVGWSIAAMAIVGILASQARGPLLGYAISLALVAYYYVTIRFYARWKVLGSLFLIGIIVVCLASGNPLATLLNFSGIDPATRWNRQAIWEAIVPMLLQQSPVFGLGPGAEWNWQVYGGLYGDSVDAMWLRIAMITGIPASFLVLFTLIGAYWNGPLDRSPYLSREERRLSVALGIATIAAIFLGFTVHFWGTCWVLLGVFAGIRANLVEARACRHRAAGASIGN